MWKDIKGFEGYYQISDQGQVKSLERQITDSVGHIYIVRERIIKPWKAGRGYFAVTLSKNGKTKASYVHLLVAMAFISNPNNFPTINHINGNKLDNSVGNLEWVSYSYNNQHAYDIGLHKKGEEQYRAKLTEENVREIKRLGKYATYQQIGDKYHVSQATIRDVLIGKTWKNIK